MAGATRHFVVLTHGRTGSSLLIRSLREAGLAAFGELLHEDPADREQAARELEAHREGQDGAAYLRQFFAGDEHRGFKLFYEQARYGPASTAWDFLRQQREIAIVHLVRSDLFASWVSYEVARRTGMWALEADATAPAERAPFEVDGDEVARFFDRVHAQRAWVRRAFADHPFLEIRYEEGLRDRFDQTMARVLEHVGATGVSPPRAVLRRLATQPAETLVTNFDELRDRFRNSPHAPYFERPYATGRTDRHPGFCPRPFEFLAVDSFGKLRVCCEDWLPTPIGDMRSGSPRDQWNSPTAMAVRESILDGSYRYCRATECPDLVKGTLVPMSALSKPSHRRWVAQGRTALTDPPRKLSLGYDPTCNLKCDTCRSDFIVLKGRELDRAAAMQELVLAELLPTARQVIITGQGDAVASRLYRRLLRTLDASTVPELRVLLMTNGLTLGPMMWESFRSAQAAISGVSISMDAATPATYALNRGGKFDKLMRNLRFLGGLRERGEIDWLEISFVVQKNNYREMPRFVELAREVGCSSVLFMKLIHWPGTFDEAEFIARAVHLPDHPDHADLRYVLRDPLLDAPDVDLSNLAALQALDHEEARA